MKYATLAFVVLAGGLWAATNSFSGNSTDADGAPATSNSTDIVVDDPTELTAVNDMFSLLEDVVFEHENLRMIPIVASQKFLDANAHFGNYTTLDDAMSNKLISVTERPANYTRPTRNNDNETDDQGEQQLQLNSSFSYGGDGSTVNTLFAKNTSQDTIFVMAGEVIKGGKQDRVMAQDFLIAPGEEKDVSVFCVEHGRWQQNGTGYEFADYATTIAPSARKAVLLEKDQHAVWDSVKVVTLANAAGSSTGTYNALEASEDYNKKKQGYIEALASLPNAHSNIVGVMVVSGDKVIGTEVFYAPEMFRKKYDGLLESYATQAITSGDRPILQQEVANMKLQRIATEINACEQVQTLPDSSRLQLMRGNTVLHYADFE